MSKSAKCEIWVTIDPDGDWATGSSAENSAEEYIEQIGGNGPLHTVKLNLTVHFPPTPEVDVEVPVPGNA